MLDAIAGAAMLTLGEDSAAAPLPNITGQGSQAGEQQGDGTNPADQAAIARKLTRAVRPTSRLLRVILMHPTRRGPENSRMDES